MTRVLVTGAAGFIARHLIPALVGAGYEVIALDKEATSGFRVISDDKPHFTYLCWDICNQSDMELLGRELEIDAVIHLAALAAPRVAETIPAETFRINVLGTYNVLKIAREAGAKRIVFPSTAHVYGISPKYLPTDENAPLALQSTYTVSKILGEQLCALFYLNYNLSFVVLRMFNGYGPGQSSDYFIPSIINQALKGDVVVHGKEITKDFVYVEDIVEAMMRALSSNYVGVLNIGTGIQTSLGFVAEFIATHFNRKLEFAGEPDDKGPTRMQCDYSRAQATLGWSPQTSLTDGLVKTLRLQIPPYT